MVSLLLFACQASGDDPAAGNAGLNAAAGAPVGAAAAASGATVFVQTFPRAGYPTPDTTSRGRFAIRDGCLVFESGGEAWRAVLPAGSRFDAPDGVVLAGGRRAALGRELVVKGGEGEFGPESGIPAACPSKAMLIGDLE